MFAKKDMQFPAPTPLVAESLGRKAYLRLRHDLMIGRYLPGQKLKLRDLADELGISITPIREGLMQLVSENALLRVDHRTVRVPVMKPERFVEIRDLRIALEGMAAARAAEIATPEQIAIIEMAHHEHSTGLRTGDFTKVLYGNERFHLGVCEIAKMPTLMRIIESLWLQTGPVVTTLRQWRPEKNPERHPHAVVIQALRDHDSEKARFGIQQDIMFNGEGILKHLTMIDEAGTEADAEETKTRRKPKAKAPVAPKKAVKAKKTK